MNNYENLDKKKEIYKILNEIYELVLEKPSSSAHRTEESSIEEYRWVLEKAFKGRTIN